MSGHLPQPARYPGYSDAASYLGVSLQGSYEPQTQHVVNATHFPLVQTSACSSYQHQFVAQQRPVVPSSSVSSVTSLPASSPPVEVAIDELKHDKEAIYTHPLFPLLELLFEKCELATTTSWEQQEDKSVVYPSRRVNDDIATFAKKIRSSFPYYTSQPDVDALMVQAIQTLRFHLMELEKVHELCHSFCERYVSCLKGKMPMDLAINSERDFSTLASESAAVMADSILPLTGMSGEESRSPDFLTDHQMFGSVGAITPTTPSDTGVQESGFESVGLSIDSPRVGIPPNGTALGITTMTAGHGQPLALQTAGAIDTSESDVASAGGEEVVPKEKAKTRKRGIFPKSATNIMKAWLFQHLSHPYPSEEQKRQLSQETGLTILQVNNWFINARRRIVQPMIDASNRAGKLPVLSSFRVQGKKSPDPGSPSCLPSGGMAPFPAGQPIPTSHTMQMAGGEPFMAQTMIPQGAGPPQAVMPVQAPPLRQGTNAPLPLTHLPPSMHQGMLPNAAQGMMPGGMPLTGMPQPGYPGMAAPGQSMPPQPMFVPCPPYQQMMPHQHMMPAPGLAMVPPSQAIPASTMVSPSSTVLSPPCSFVSPPCSFVSPPCSFVSPPSTPQAAPPLNVVPQGYMVASTVPAPHLTYHPQHVPVMIEHPQQQQ